MGIADRIVTDFYKRYLVGRICLSGDSFDSIKKAVANRIDAPYPQPALWPSTVLLISGSDNFNV